MSIIQKVGLTVTYHFSSHSIAISFFTSHLLLVKCRAPFAFPAIYARKTWLVLGGMINFLDSTLNNSARLHIIVGLCTVRGEDAVCAFVLTPASVATSTSHTTAAAGRDYDALQRNRSSWCTTVLPRSCFRCTRSTLPAVSSYSESTPMPQSIWTKPTESLSISSNRYILR
jgi:hypothetical protein